MKKILFIIMMLLTPSMVFAYLNESEVVFYFGDQEETYYDFWSRVDRIGFVGRDSTSSYQYSTDYEYVDGLYYLTGSVTKSSYDMLIHYNSDFSGHDILYTCASETETSCNQLRVVFTRYTTAINTNATTLRIENGETVEDIRYYTVADGFEKVGNKYRLVNPYQYDIATIIDTEWDLKDKYMCADKKSAYCDELYYIVSPSATSLLVNSTAKQFKFGKSYEYVDGKYILKDVVEDDWWPNYSSIKGVYSCLTDSIECTNMVYINNYKEPELAYSYEFWELYSGGHFDMDNLTYKTETVEIPVGGVVLGASYFTNINAVEIMDSSIIKLDGDNFVPLKVGDTFLVERNGSGTKVLHVFVTQEMLDAYNAINPKTKTGVMIVISAIFTLLLVAAFIIKKKRYN